MRLIVSAIVVLWCLFIVSCSSPKIAPGEQTLKEHFYKNNDSLLGALELLDSSIKQKLPPTQLKNQFTHCRRLFKKNEALIEYYFQGLTRRINGPALPDVKIEDGQVWPPHGFQVIEQALYEGYPDSAIALISNEVKLLQTDLLFVKANMQHNTILPRHAAELLQHECIRIATLGITGFDSPISLQSLPEAIAALEGIKEFCVNFYGTDVWTSSLENIYRESYTYLYEHNNFDQFDRMAFLTLHLMPFSSQLSLLYKADSADSLFRKPFNGTMADLMKGKGFNAAYYANYAQNANTSQLALLGKQLFSDTRLSRSGTMSCASCHQADKALTDGLAKASNMVHGGNLLRNTPSLYYAALQSHQFFDMRSTTLEDQIYDVMQSGNEFAFSDKEIAQKLQADTQYQQLFSAAFGKADSITGYNTRNAIAAYVRSLLPFASSFDAYMNGSKQAMSNMEVAGFNLFMGKAKCGTCHFMPLFNGNTPPFFNKSESEIIGVPARLAWANASIDNDEGRYRINEMEELRYSFKTPTLRNVASTAPYMHNGVYTTLDEVVEFYHKGGGVGLGIDLPYQSLPFDSLVLSPGDKKNIVAFMRTLTDK